MTIQGNSLATIDKERCIASALSIGMKIANKAFGGKRFRFWHFDANAGDGWNRKTNKAGEVLIDVPGSPLVFHEMADQHLPDMRRCGFFCDINEAALSKLLHRLRGVSGRLECSFLFPGDNEEALEVFAAHIRSHENPAHAIGSVIVDPNGYWYRNAKGIGAPVQSLRQFVNDFPKIDLVLNLNTRIYRLQKSQAHDVAAPLDVLLGLNKKHWLVRRTQCGGDEFLLAVGRNTPTGDHRAIGMHKLDSEEGRHIMSTVEGKRQGSLFHEDPLRDVPAVPVPSGVQSSSSGGYAAGRGSVPLRPASD